jgi:hypothetical protein
MLHVSNIACLGNQFDPECQRVIDKFSIRYAYRFVFGGWVPPDGSVYRLAWVVDGSVEPEALVPWLREGVPVLVPEASVGLRQFTGEPAVGLSYVQAEDAEACLLALTLDDDLYGVLRANAFAARA